MRPVGRLLLLTALGIGPQAQAQFTSVPAPQRLSQPAASAASDAPGYRRDAAQHLYRSYPGLIWQGRLPATLHAIAVVQTTLDDQGRIVDLQVTREPAYAREVTAWILALIRRAAPFPPPRALGTVRYTDVWLVDESGHFQLDTLTEGQLDE